MFHALASLFRAEQGADQWRCRCASTPPGPLCVRSTNASCPPCTRCERALHMLWAMCSGLCLGGDPDPSNGQARLPGTLLAGQ